jgi:hypothetical protein
MDKLDAMRTGPIALAVLLIGGAAALAQRGGLRFQGHDEGPEFNFPEQGEFHFLRVEYTDMPQYHRGFGFASRDARGTGWWLVDWPDADEHFSEGVQRLTRVDVGRPVHMSLTDNRLFENPFIYATQTGWWDLNNEETARLREFLLRGGFIMTDDFWSTDPEEWAIFQQTMARVLPDKPISDIAMGDSVMHVLYDIQQKDLSFIPGTRHLRRGPGGSVVVQQPFGTNPAWRAMYDDKNRMIVAVNFNTDIGDAWEYADAPEYPEHMTALAYRYGINYLVYSMTH